MRAVAISLVVATHLFWSRIPGAYGVTLFFLISGFLITRLMLLEMRSGRVDVAGFYWRRILRLYPAILVFCSFAIIFDAMHGAVDWRAVASVLFYFANYEHGIRSLSGPGLPDHFQIFWSLAVEEHFYILFPLAASLLRTPPRIALAAGTVFVACVACKLWFVLRHPGLAEGLYFYTATQFRVDAIALGVAIAALCEMPSAHRVLGRLSGTVSIVTGVVGLAFAWLLLVDIPLRAALMHSLAVLAMAPIFIAILFRPHPAQALLNSRPAIWLGKRSYSLYIWHMPALMVLPWGPAAFVLALAAACASYRYVERPVRARRLTPAIS